ncbi:MAG: hypothetical protein OSB41_00615 [Kiritimatiellae bacterium]|nr:hypothetical protein [Kiritimatiellia bacterium]
MVFGFLPVGLGYHMAFSLLSAAVWALAVKVAWLTDGEQWAARADFGKASEHDTLLFGMMPVAVILPASAPTMRIVSLLTRPPAPAIVERFIPSVGDGFNTAS